MDAVQQDDLIKNNFKLLCSIPGIGLITAAAAAAVALILCTNNFTAFADSRKFASYCGVAPFEHKSGTSIRATVATGRTKTSHLANKRIKALLSNCAGHPVLVRLFNGILR